MSIGQREVGIFHLLDIQNQHEQKLIKMIGTIFPIYFLSNLYNHLILAETSSTSSKPAQPSNEKRWHFMSFDMKVHISNVQAEEEITKRAKSKFIQACIP